MAEGTAEFFLRPQDGWVAVATAPVLHTLIRSSRAHIGLAVGASPPSTADTPASANLSYTGRPTAGTKAVGTLTFEDDAGAGDAAIAGDTFTIDTAVYTLSAAPAVAGDVLLGADNLETAVNLAAAINGDALNTAHPLFSAGVVSLVLTITALLNGTASNAVDTLTDSGGAAWGAATPVDGVAGETITLDTTVYTFATTLSTPAHVAGGSPNEVLIGADADGDYANLDAAINGTGTEGTTYGNNTTSHPANLRSVHTAGSDDLLIAGGPGQNGVAVAETLSNAAFDGSATALAGGAPALLGFQFGGSTQDFDDTIRLDDVQGNVYVRALHVGARRMDVEPVRVTVIQTGT